MRIRFILLLLLIASPAFGQGTPKSKSVLNSEVSSQLPDNSSGAITPAIVRSVLNDFIASWQQYSGVNAQTGTSYTFLASDYGQTVTFSNSGAISAILPQPTGSSFGTYNVTVYNVGTGTITLTATGGTINGSASQTLTAGGSVVVVSDGTGTNYISRGLPTYLSCALFPTLTGDVTTTHGSCVTTITPSAVTNAKLANMANTTIKGNISGGSAAPSDLTAGQVGSMLCVPVLTVLTSGSSATYTTPTCNSVLATWLQVEVQGGGAGGGGSGTTPTNSTAGNQSSFGALVAGGGGANNLEQGGAGGTCSGSLGTQQNFPGSSGGGIGVGTAASNSNGGAGGVSFYGGNAGASYAGNAGTDAPLNSGGGGSGGAGNATAGVFGGGGGGAGCHISAVVSSPASSYTYTVGALAAKGSAGTSGFAGGNGGAGVIIVTAHWQ